MPIRAMEKLNLIRDEVDLETKKKIDELVEGRISGVIDSAEFNKQASLICNRILRRRNDVDTCEKLNRKYITDEDLNFHEYILNKREYKDEYFFQKLSDHQKETRMRLKDMEMQLRRLMDRPQLFEKEAEKKLMEINQKFDGLMMLNDGNSSLSENISKVDNLSEKLEKLEKDAHSLISGTSTVQLGKHYLECKKSYGWNYYPFNWMQLKEWRKPANLIRLLVIFVVRNVLQKDLFLYLCFLGALCGLGWFYFEFMKNNANFDLKNAMLALPLIWAAWFFQRKINTREKLYEIYNHKQKVMETYVAFKNGSYTFNAEDKMEEALLIAIKKDPSDCVGKDNTTLVECLLDKMQGMFVSRKFEKSFRNED